MSIDACSSVTSTTIPLAAGIVADAIEYPHGSAKWYSRSKGPPWLTRSWIEATVSRASERPFTGEDYAVLFRRPMDSSTRSWVEWITRQDCAGQDDLDELLDLAPVKVRAWMRERTKVADGTAIGFPVCVASAIMKAVDAGVRSGRLGAGGSASGCNFDPSELKAALLFQCCGLSQGEVSRVCGLSKERVAFACRRHRARIVEDGEYVESATDVVLEALREGHLGRVLDIPSEMRVRLSMREG